MTRYLVGKEEVVEGEPSWRSRMLTWVFCSTGCDIFLNQLVVLGDHRELRASCMESEEEPTALLPVEE